MAEEDGVSRTTVQRELERSSKVQRRLIIAAFFVLLIPPAIALYLINNIASEVQSERETARCSTYAILRVLQPVARELGLDQSEIILPDIQGLECNRILTTPVSGAFEDERGSRMETPAGPGNAGNGSEGGGSTEDGQPPGGNGGGQGPPGPPGPPGDEGPPGSPPTDATPSPEDTGVCIDPPSPLPDVCPSLPLSAIR